MAPIAHLADMSCHEVLVKLLIKANRSLNDPNFVPFQILSLQLQPYLSMLSMDVERVLEDNIALLVDAYFDVQ